MIEQIDHSIYKIEVPLPKSPLKATNSYFIRGAERNLLVDNGFNQPECRQTMDDAQRELGFSMDNTDLFLTHVHSDHIGLSGYLEQPGTIIYTGQFCANCLQEPIAGKGFRAMVIESGLSQMGISPDDPSVHPGYAYAPAPVKNIRIVSDGDIISVGNLKLRCIDTTGHAPNHMCLYEESTQLLFTGDHILGTITPNNTIWEDPWAAKTDYLGLYLKNLDKLTSLSIRLGLPGHRAVIENCYKRIEELKDHHERRLQLVLDILGTSASFTGAQVAEQMQWDIRAKSWQDFPPAQKYFATGEALSHLVHLIFRGQVRKELVGDAVQFARI